jgi:uncharacterized protein YbbC (DUF1343 family)/CubicO group peptidase (beta-lactamase class C family)
MNSSKSHLRIFAIVASLALFASLSSAAQYAITTNDIIRYEKQTAMDAAINEAIAEGKCPGGVLWVEQGGHYGVRDYHKAFGKRAVVPADETMTEDTIFDAASLTKVVACTPAVMLLVERGQLSLEDRVAKYLPEFTGGGKEEVTIRQLITHTSGLRPDISLKPDWTGYEEAIRLSCAEKLATKPGEKLVYSDTGPILLGEIVRRISGKSLDQFLQVELYGPLGMKDTGFNPPKEKIDRIAPTEVENGVSVRGVVHDPRARRMGGVAGHAGLFVTASDLARYSRMLLNGGELDGVRIFKPETVNLMTSVQTPSNVTGRRGIGWDIDSSYSGPRGELFPLGSYGHTGWTGTSIWIDPFSKTFVIFLSNRNHPTEKGSVIALRKKLGTLAAQWVADFDFGKVAGALPPRTGNQIDLLNEGVVTKLSGRAAVLTHSTLNGIDVLVKKNFAPLKGKRIGLVTNHTGQDRARRATIDLLKNAPGVTLVALFGPEHGIRGEVDEKFTDSKDAKTGLPIYSLYGERRKPTVEQLKGLDALVFDIQDVGCRFYTYTSTMGLCMEAAAEAGIEFIVLDRANPIDGVTIDGPVLTEKTSFVGFHAKPLRYAMTMGELAKMYNEERKTNAKLTVIELENWRRDAYYDETGLPWTNPSPNMRNLKQAILYPGVGLVEQALSVGRGTDTPFEVVGAPYIDDVKLAEELNRAALPGMAFVPIRFTPTYSVHKGKECGGVFIMLNDRTKCNVVDVGLLIMKTVYRLYPKDFPVDKPKNLLLHAATLHAIKADKPLDDIRATWRMDLVDFQQRRERYLIYK